MSLEIIFGKNKTGKTEFLKNQYNNFKDEKILFIPSEINYDRFIIGNLGTPTKPYLSPHKKFEIFFNKIIGEKYTVKFKSKDYNNLKKWKNFFDSFFQEIQADGDSFFEGWFKNIFQYNQSLNENNIEILYSLVNVKEYVTKNLPMSSGSFNYSAIKLLYKIITSDKIKKKKINIKEYKLIIDEVEKFLHPELIVKVAYMLVEISKVLDVVVTTHSPLFLEKIFYINKNNIKHSVKYSLKYNDYFPWTIKQEQIIEILKKENYRTLSYLSNLLFSSKCFLVEGLLDTNIINDIIQNNPKLADKHYTIIDCSGKLIVEKMYKLISKLEISNNSVEKNIIEFYKICLFYDLDDGNNKKEITIN